MHIPPRENLSSVSLSGRLSSTPIVHLLQWIDRARKTGTLLLHGERFTKTIVTRGGKVIASASTDPTDYLRNFLLRQGRITEAQLKKAIDTQRQTRAMLGRILVTVGLIERADLEHALLQKAEETIFSLFLWRDGRFEFRDGIVPEKTLIPFTLPISEVLLKGLTWGKELQHIRRAFASSGSVPARTGRRLPAASEGTDSFPRRVLTLVDGRRSIADICLEVHASEFTVSKLLYEMHERGCIKVTQQFAVEEDSVPELLEPLENLMSESLTSEERFLLRRVDGSRDIRAIVSAYPFGERDAVLHLKHLEDRGFISLEASSLAADRCGAVRSAGPAAEEE